MKQLILLKAIFLNSHFILLSLFNVYRDGFTCYTFVTAEVNTAVTYSYLVIDYF